MNTFVPNHKCDAKFSRGVEQKQKIVEHEFILFKKEVKMIKYVVTERKLPLQNLQLVIRTV